MRILINSVNRFSAPTGICRYAANLAQALAGAGEVQQVRMTIGSWQQAHFERWLGGSAKIELVVAPLRNTAVERNRWFWAGLPRFAAGRDADLLHLAFPVPIGRRRMSTPVVVTVHDLYAFDSQNWSLGGALVRRWIFRRCIARADAVVCDSRATQARFLELFTGTAPGKPVEVVSLFGNPLAQERRPAAVPGNSRFFLMVAQHRANKRIDLLLEAFARLRQQPTIAPETRLVVVGAPGPESGNLRQLAARLGLEQQADWLHGLDDAELAWLYRHCELLVCSSDDEGFGLPVLEGLQHGCRVVCSDLPVLREIAGTHARYFVPGPEAVSNLAAAMQQAMADARPGPLQLPYSAARMAEECLRVYRKVLGGKASLPKTAPAMGRSGMS